VSNFAQSARPATSAPNSSSLTIVTAGERRWTSAERPPAPEKNQIRQVQFVTAEPAAAAPAGERSSIEFEPAATAQPAPAIAERQPQPRPAAASPTGEALARINPQLAGQMRQALETPGAYFTRATLSQLPRRTAARPAAPASARTPSKPFQGVQNAPTVSPYLNLDRDENDDEVAANYFAFVRPQTEQFEANRMQQIEMQRMQRQVQSGSATVATPQRGAAAISQTGSSTRFMDTAQFYGAWQR
jgi:hypothetical protein